MLLEESHNVKVVFKNEQILKVQWITGIYDIDTMAKSITEKFLNLVSGCSLITQFRFR